MEHIIGIHTLLIAGLLEVIWFNWGLARAEFAYMAGGRNAETFSVIGAMVIALVAAVKLSIALVWWYFAVVIAMFVILAFANFILFPILRLISFFFGAILAFWREAPCVELENSFCEIHGGRLLSAIYTLFGGGCLLFYIFRVM